MKLLDDLLPLLTFPNDEKSTLKDTLRVPSTLVLGISTAQIQGFSLALQKQALHDKRPCCLLPVSSPEEFAHLLLDIEYDSQTHELSTVPGPLWRCLEAENGLLILLFEDDIAVPTAEGLNGIFDRTAYHDINLKKPILVHKNLQIVGLCTASSKNFKLCKASKSQRDRFRQIRWLASSLTFALLPSLKILDTTKEKKTHVDSSSHIITIDCSWLTGEELQSYLFITYPRNNKGQREPKLGKLTCALENKATHIILKNIDLTLPSTQYIIDELRALQYLKQPLKINQRFYELHKIVFLLAAPITTAELSEFSKGKYLEKVTIQQIEKLARKKDIYWLNLQSYEELYELTYRQQSFDVKDMATYWHTDSGFLDFFKNANQEIHAVVIKPLPMAAWYRLLQNPTIKVLCVLNTVNIPALFSPLFIRGELEFLAKAKVFSTSPVPLVLRDDSSWIKVCICPSQKQLTRIDDMLETYGTEHTLVIHSAKDHDRQLLTQYDDKHEAKLGPLLTALKSGKRVILTGDMLFDQIPNFFNLRALVQHNKTISHGDFSGELILLIDNDTLLRNPFLKILPTLDYEFKSRPTKTREAKIGYKGLLETLSIQENWLVFIQGPKASGKTYSLSGKANVGILKDAHLFHYTLSGATSFTDLAPTIQRWSQLPTKGDFRLRLLVLDEINLADPTLLLFLLGFPTICLPDGNVIHLDPAIHRIICLMNPAETTANRTVHHMLQSRACIVDYPAMTIEELHDLIIVPALISEWRINKSWALTYGKLLITLHQQVSLLEPKAQLNSRDFLAIIAKVATVNYRLPELKSVDMKQSSSTDFEQALLHAIEQIVFSQLTPFNAQALHAWWLQQLDRTAGKQPLLATQYASQLLIQYSELWNTQSSQRYLATLFSFMQTYYWYSQQHRIMPGKAGVLVLGGTNSGKSYLSHFLLEKLGFNPAHDCLEMTLGVNVDLAEVIAEAKKRNNKAPILLHEANLAPPQILEGLNAALTGDDLPVTLILTANKDYPFRQQFSEPFLSRLDIFYIEDFSAAELLKIHKISEEKLPTQEYSDFDYVLMLHKAVGLHASSRLLLNAIYNYLSGISLTLACAMTYGILLRELKAQLPVPESKKTIKEQAFSSYLLLLEEHRLIVTFGSTQSLGELLVKNGQIKLPSLSIKATSAEYQHIYNIILWRTLQYQLIRLLVTPEVKNDNHHHYYQFCELLALRMIDDHYPGCQAFVLLISESKPMSYSTAYDLSLLPMPKTATLAGIMAFITENHDLLKQTIYEFISFISPKSPKISKISDALTRNQYSVSTIPVFIKETFSKAISFTEKKLLKTPKRTSVASGSTSLKLADYPSLALLEDERTLCFPAEIFAMDSSGLPILQGGSFPATELSEQFFPKSKPIKSTDAFQITLTTPHIENKQRISLLVPSGYYPELEEDSKSKLIWKEGQFYAYDNYDKITPSTFSYRLIAGDAKDPVSFREHKFKSITPFINIDDLDSRLRDDLYALQEASTISQQRLCATQLCTTLQQTLIYLDQDHDFKERQTLNDLYAKNDIKALTEHLLDDFKVVCLESAFLFYVLFQLFRSPKVSAMPYLVNGLVSVQGEITQEGHAYVLIRWPDQAYPQVFDPTPSVSPPSSVIKKNQSPVLASATTHCTRDIKTAFPGDLFGHSSTRLQDIEANPLLISYHKRISKALTPLLQYLSHSSLDNNRQQFKLNPPGKFIIKREGLGLLPFMSQLPKDDWKPQTLLIVAPPDIMERKINLFTQWSCVHFLIQLLLEKKFTILIWHQSTAHTITDANECIQLIQKLRPPTAKELENFHYPHACKKIDKAAWQEILLQYAQILQMTIPNEAKARYIKLDSKENITTCFGIENIKIRHHNSDIKSLFIAFDKILKGHYLVQFEEPIEVLTDRTTKYLYKKISLFNTTINKALVSQLENIFNTFNLHEFYISIINCIIEENAYDELLECFKHFEYFEFKQCQFNSFKIPIYPLTPYVSVSTTNDQKLIDLIPIITIKNTNITNTLYKSLSFAVKLYFNNCNFTDPLDFSTMKYIHEIQISESKGKSPKWNTLSRLKSLTLQRNVWLDSNRQHYDLLTEKSSQLVIYGDKNISNHLRIKPTSLLQTLHLDDWSGCIRKPIELICDKIINIELYRDDKIVIFISNFKSTGDDLASQLQKIMKYKQKNICFIIDTPDSSYIVETLKNIKKRNSSYNWTFIPPPAAAVDFLLDKTLLAKSKELKIR